MSMDRSLKAANALTRHRNVLTRAERIARLKDQESWEEGKSPFGLPKVANRNLKVGKKTKKKEEGAEGTAAAAAASAAPAAPAKK
ncbi:MAG: small basic protein [Planctomycetes bacterium]|nr:small basic protein [Planctomycetota bacterium]